MTVQKFIKEIGLRMEVWKIDSRPDMSGDDEWMKGATHFHCRLNLNQLKGHPKENCYPKIYFDTYYSRGSAFKGEKPFISDVIDSLVNDCLYVDNGETFDEFCENLGYNSDSIKNKKLYDSLLETRSKLKKFLGYVNYKKLLYDTERL